MGGGGGGNWAEMLWGTCLGGHCQSVLRTCSFTATLYVREMAPPFNVVMRATGEYTTMPRVYIERHVKDKLLKSSVLSSPELNNNRSPPGVPPSDVYQNDTSLF